VTCHRHCRTESVSDALVQDLCANRCLVSVDEFWDLIGTGYRTPGRCSSKTAEDVQNDLNAAPLTTRPQQNIAHRAANTLRHLSDSVTAASILLSTLDAPAIASPSMLVSRCFLKSTKVGHINTRPSSSNTSGSTMSKLSTYGAFVFAQAPHIKKKLNRSAAYIRIKARKLVNPTSL